MLPFAADAPRLSSATVSGRLVWGCVRDTNTTNAVTPVVVGGNMTLTPVSDVAVGTVPARDGTCVDVLTVSGERVSSAGMLTDSGTS